MEGFVLTNCWRYRAEAETAELKRARAGGGEMRTGITVQIKSSSPSGLDLKPELIFAFEDEHLTSCSKGDDDVLFEAEDIILLAEWVLTVKSRVGERERISEEETS